MDDDKSVIAWHLAKRPQIPYYHVRNGNGFWEPTARMKKLGFASTPCGPDGPEARARAWAMNTAWQRVRTSGQAARKLPPRRGFIYFLRAGDAVKIGFSGTPLGRFLALKTGIADQITAIVVVRGTQADESRLHRELVHYRKEGEWFTATAPVLEVMARSAAIGRPARGSAEPSDAFTSVPECRNGVSE